MLYSGEGRCHFPLCVNRCCLVQSRRSIQVRQRVFNCAPHRGTYTSFHHGAEEGNGIGESSAFRERWCIAAGESRLPRHRSEPSEGRSNNGAISKSAPAIARPLVSRIDGPFREEQDDIGTGTGQAEALRQPP